MKAAIVGTGNIAQVHARETLALGHTIPLVVGHSLSGARKFAEQYGSEIWTEQITPSLFQKVDCVQICTPPHLHYETVKLCLQEGKHVICEKPLTLSSREAEELCRLADESGVVATVAFNNRYYESTERMRETVQSEAFGEPFLIHGHYFQEFHMLPAPYSWRYSGEGGQRLRAVTEIGSHFIDLFRYLTGLEVEQVSAVFSRAYPQRYLREGLMYPTGKEQEKVWVDSEDAAMVTFRLEGGVLASAVFSEVSPGRSNDLSMEILSRHASASWGSERPYEVVTGRRGEGLTARCNAFGGGFAGSFEAYFREAFACMETGKISRRLPTFRDGARNALICEGIGRSALEGGSWIDVKGDAHGQQG